MKSDDTDKKREICFHSFPENQAGRALVLLTGMEGLEVFPGTRPNSIIVCYNVLDYTLQGLESALMNQGFHLENSLLQKIRRALCYYCEEVQLDNLHAPERRKKSQEIFIQAYEHHEHGDHDATPEEWREYR